MKNFLTLVCGLLCIGSLYADDYRPHAEIVRQMEQLANRYPDKVAVEKLAVTTGSNGLYVIKIGTGQLDQQPAVAVFGGTDGRHLFGVELALGLAEKLAEAGDLLSQQTFYVFPNVNPDATEQYFAPLRYERTLNANATDNDRDGRLNEDPYEDLNGDGLITLMRVESPAGNYVTLPQDERVLVPADIAKGLPGKYLVYTEGLDNDKDGLWNEDDDGGVNFNRNFTYQYQNFQPESGEYAVSEIETRAVADFLYEAWNVHTVLSFGLHNNLSSPAKAGMTVHAGTGDENENDTQINTWVSRIYNRYLPEMAGAKGLETGGGEFYTWAYQHYGRYSYTTPGWWPVSAAAHAADSANTSPDLLYVQWAAENGVTDYFVAWTAIDHPDFPGQRVEVGGFKPHVRYNPPHATLERSIEQHFGFLKELAALAPKLRIDGVRTEKLEKSITRVTLRLRNEGTMPTLNQIGQQSYFLKYITVQLHPASDMQLLHGNRKLTHPVLQGGEEVEYSWLIQGSGKLRLEAGCPTAGYDSAEITL